MRILSLFGSILILAGSGGAAAPPAPPAMLGAAQWQQDLDFMVAQLERRHANLYHAVSRQP